MSKVLLDLRRLDANLARFHGAANDAGVRVRAHLKAHRTVELAQRQVAQGAAGVAVQTAHAARVLASHGIDDVVLAWPWRDGWRFPMYAETAATVAGFAVHVDHPDAIAGIGAAAVERGTEVAVRLDLRHSPDGTAIELARLAHGTPGVRLEGVTGYCATETLAEVTDREAVGTRYAEWLVSIANAIRAEGFDCPVVCVGGTPASAGALRVEGVTEICAGAYGTYDGGLAAAGVCAPEQVALFVDPSAGLLDECSQPWAPGVSSYPAVAPYDDRAVPAHICPFALTLLRQGTPITVLDDGREAGSWLPFAAPDRDHAASA